MDSATIIRMIASFMIGGAYIVIIARFAEILGSSAGGALAATPSTILISNIFLALAEGKEALHDSIPGTIIAISCTLILLVIFANIYQKKSFKFSIAVSLSTWLLCILILDRLAVASIEVACLTYVIFLALSWRHFKSIPDREASFRQTSNFEIFSRMILAGFVVVAVLIAVKISGGYWGGVIAGFPIIFL